MACRSTSSSAASSPKSDNLTHRRLSEEDYLATKKKSTQTYNFPKTAGARNKSGVLNAVTEATGLRRKEVAGVMGALAALIAYDMAKTGTFTLPGLAKMSVIKKAATKARKGINPFTKEPTIFKAKPARKIVKIRPLKALKDFVK
jgi:nucleoid DNA-binding protein